MHLQKEKDGTSDTGVYEGHFKRGVSRWKVGKHNCTVIKISDDTDDHSVYVSVFQYLRIL